MSHHASAKTGEFCLILLLAARRRSPALLQQTLRAIAQECPDAAAKWILNKVRAHLSSKQQAWLDGSLRKLHDNPESDRSPYSYLWQPVGKEPLRCEAHTRLTQAEVERLQAIAKQRGMTRAALQREIVQRYLAEVASNAISA